MAERAPRRMSTIPPPVSVSNNPQEIHHQGSRYNSAGYDLYDYRTYIPARRSGLAIVTGPLQSSPPSPSSPPPLSPNLIFTFSDDDSILPINPPSPTLSISTSGWDAYWEDDDGDMSLPGLGLDDVDDAANIASGSFGANTSAGAQSQTQQYELKPETEWRFELAIGRSITVKVVSGQPELFATDLVVGHSYTFTSIKAAIFTWLGCTFTVTSDYGPLSSALTSEYVAEDTPCHEYMNVHNSLDQMRDRALTNSVDGPRALLVGPENSGKSSLAKTLVAYAVRTGRSPVVVNLDPNEGVLSLPGTLTTAVFKTPMEVEEGWGTAPMSGPNGEIPVKLPLVYYYGSMNPDDKGGSIFKNQVRQLALAVAGRFAEEGETRTSGVVVDTPGSLVNARAAGSGYDILTHVVSEFGINCIICLGSERLYSDMVKKFDTKPTSRPVPPTQAGQEAERIAVVKITNLGGVAERDLSYMQAIRQTQTKRYFYGDPRIGAGIVLQPRQQQVDFDSLTIWRRISSTSGPALSLAGGVTSSTAYDEDSFLPGGADDDADTTNPASTSAVPLPASQIFERLTSPIPALRNCILAVMNCAPDPDAGSEQEVLRDSSVMGFLYVTDVDEGRRRISLLSPVAGRVPARALAWGEGIDGVLGLV